MSTVRRPKTAFTNDAQTTKFLYLILKQLDLKTINWQEVADNIGIKNGHAARMRWSRFKQHAEGTPPQPKQTKAKKNDGEKGKGKRDREDADLSKEDDGQDEKRVKLESGFSPAPPPHGSPAFDGYPSMPFSMPHAMPPAVKQEPLIKAEPGLGPVTISTPKMGPSLPSQHREPFPLCNNPPPPTFTPTKDEDVDDIPIKQLVSPREATVSMADLQLNSPLKQDFQQSATSASSIPAPSTSPDRNASSAILSPSRMNADYSVPVDSASQAAEEQVPLQRDSTPATFPESMIPQSHAPAWNSPSSQPPSAYGMPFPPWPPVYRHYPHPQQYQQPFGHASPYGMGYQQRPMMPPFGHMGMYPNYTPPFAQQGGQQHMFMQGSYQPMLVPTRGASPGRLPDGFSGLFDAAPVQNDIQQPAGECKKNSTSASGPIEAPMLSPHKAVASIVRTADKDDGRSNLGPSISAQPSGSAEQKSKSIVLINPSTQSQVTASPSKNQQSTHTEAQRSHETPPSAANTQLSATSCPPRVSATPSGSEAAPAPDVPDHPTQLQDAAHVNHATSPVTKNALTKATAEYGDSTAVEADAWLLDADFDFDLDGSFQSSEAGSSSTTSGPISGSSTAPIPASSPTTVSAAAAGETHQTTGSLIFSIPGLTPASKSIPTSAPTSAPTPTSMPTPAATPSTLPPRIPTPTNPPTPMQTSRSTTLPVSQPTRMPLQPQHLILDDVIIMESMSTNSPSSRENSNNSRV